VAERKLKAIAEASSVLRERHRI